jgi:hypothetical protein
MKPFQPTPELIAVARRVVWFQKPEETLEDPIRFLAYVMCYGTAEDLVMLEKAGVGLDEYREVLDNAPSGVLDPRSWTFWNLKCGQTPVPPLPVRTFGLG